MFIVNYIQKSAKKSQEKKMLQTTPELARELLLFKMSFIK